MTTTLAPVAVLAVIAAQLTGRIMAEDKKRNTESLRDACITAPGFQAWVYDETEALFHTDPHRAPVLAARHLLEGKMNHQQRNNPS